MASKNFNTLAQIVARVHALDLAEEAREAAMVAEFAQLPAERIISMMSDEDLWCQCPDCPERPA